MRASQPKGLLYTLLCGLLWSTAGVLMKLLPWHPLAIAGLRSGLCAVFLYGAMVVLQKEIRVLIDRQTLSNAFFLCLTMLLFCTANKLTTAANAIVLQSTSTVFILLYGIVVLRQKPQRRDLVTTICVFVGIVLFFIDQLSPRGLLGNAVALGSAVTFAGVFLTATEAKSEHAAMSGLILGQVFTAVVGVPFCFAAPMPVTPAMIGAILWLGFFQLGLAYTLYSYASQMCSPLAMALVAMVEPVCSPIWVALFAREIPGPSALLGAAIVLVSLTVWSVLNARSRTERLQG